MVVDASAVDFFCGAGGLSYGFVTEGVPVAAGIDVDELCRYPFEQNVKAPFVRSDIGNLSVSDVKPLFHKGKKRIVIGCAPCQPFSTYNQKNSDPSWKLLGKFGELITEIRPDVVSMENVPRLVKFAEGRVFDEFVRRLEGSGYHANWANLYCPDFGLPQTRTRLVLMASRLGPIELPKPTHLKRHRSVREAIGNLPPVDSGGVDKADPLHRASRLSERNLLRMRAAIPGGTWRDWDRDLVVDCHKEDSGRGYSSVYGRMTWDEPSPTITTQFFGFGNGRFGHPDQDRALTLREGAILQGFPKGYRFFAPGQAIQFKVTGRMIGNAVPVNLARSIARAIRKHLRTYA